MANKIKIRNTHIHLTDEPRDEHLTNKCITVDARVNGFYMKGWRGEAWLDVNYKTTRGLSKIEMYRENDTFEIDIILNEKPSTNIFTYKIQTEGLDFWYQPPLTEEEIAAGHTRPEIVVGSYAVYHKTGKHNYYINGREKNYKTGKFCHIYRPQAFDSNGNAVWCDLNIDVETGTMTITVPQDFLDSAIYPVRVDPTIGNTDIGGSTYYFAQNYHNYFLFISQANAEYVPAAGGTLESISAYTWTSNNPSWPTSQDLFKVGVYTSGSIIDGSDSNYVTAVGSFEYGTYNDPKWITKPISSTLTGDIPYQVAFMVWMEDGGLDAHIRWAYDTGPDSAATKQVFVGDWNWPSTLNGWTNFGNYLFSLYITYADIESLPSIIENASIASDAVIVNPTIFTFAGPATSAVTTINEKNAKFDIKLKHVCNHNLNSGQYSLAKCPRCLGTGYYYDIKFGETGQLFEVALEDKLTQTLEKLMLTDTNRYHSEVAAGIQKWLGTLGNKENLGAIKDNIITTLINLQEIQKNVRNLSPRARIASINSIAVDLIEPGILKYTVILTTISGEEKTISGTIDIGI